MKSRFFLTARCHFLFISVLLIFACKNGPETIEVVQNYGDGKVSRTYTEIDGKKEGKMIDYYPDGSIKAERLFENNIQVGKTTIFYNSGSIKEVQYYSDGKIQGGDTVFYESGAPQFLLNFTDGIKDGYVRKWAEDGTLIYEAKYSNDTLIEVKGEPIKRDSLF